MALSGTESEASQSFLHLLYVPDTEGGSVKSLACILQTCQSHETRRKPGELFQIK